MVIGGLMGLSLVNYPKLLSAVVFINGCNLNCLYCHNPELIDCKSEGVFSIQEVLKFLQSRVGLLQGVVITGGEPLRGDLGVLRGFIGQIKAMGYKVKLDTNGLYPKKLQSLIEDSLLDFVAMDIKNTKNKYEKTVVRKIKLEKLEESIKIIQNSGLDYEFRTTVCNELHTKEDLLEIMDWIKGSRKYFIQQYRATEGVNSHQLNPLDESIIEEVLKRSRANLGLVEVRNSYK